MTDNLNILINKLDVFIKKYYLNQIIKGTILSVAILIFLYLAIVTTEYFARFSITTRTILFFSGATSFFLVFTLLILLPLLKLFKLGKRISYKDAANILGKHFPQISDKLLNTLELADISKDYEYRDIVIASINQRTEELKPLPFLRAIKIKKNLKYVKYVIPGIIMIITFIIFWPSVITEGTERIINYQTFYEVPPPFEFFLENDSLTVKRGGDFKIILNTQGRYVPDQVLFHYRGNSFFMEKVSNGKFVYNLKNLNSDFQFYFSATNLQSETYEIKVLPAPIIIDFVIDIQPPSYTKLKSSTVNNSGDITVPTGANLKWSFNTSNLNVLKAVFDTTEIIADKDEKKFSFSKRIINPTTYKILAANDFFNEQSGVNYHINVIPDIYPSIKIEEVKDSANLSIHYFYGLIDDDYGFKSLTFNYIPGEKSDTVIKINIPFSSGMIAQSFFYAFDFASIDVKGRQIIYYFEVGDNDAINGSKKTRTHVYEYIIPSLKDIEAESSRAMENIEKDVNEAQKLADEIRKDIDRLQKDILDNQLSEWERAQNIQNIIDKQSQLENLLQNASEEQKQLNQLKDQWKKDEELAQKYEQIQELLDNLIDDEMKDLLEQLKELANDFDMSEFQDLMENMKDNQGNMEKQMEKALELLKRMEVEERLKNTVQKLDDLAQEHNQLSEETKTEKRNDEQLSDEELSQKHEEQKQEFEDIKEEYDKTLEKNEDLKKPYDLEKFQEQFDEISDNLEKSKQELEKGEKKKSSETQKGNSKKMQKLSQQMQQMMDSQMQQQQMEDMRNLQQILANLLSFSFEQEDIMINLNNISSRDPRYKDFMIRQNRARDNFSVIRDSLNALGSRVPELNTVINKEQQEIYRNLNVVIDNMGDNRQFRVQSSQQLVMTSANNLALLLSEVLEQMQQQMSMNSEGEGGECSQSEGGESEGEMGKMRDIQEGLKKQLQQLLDQMKDGGQNPQGQKQGEQLAKMLKQQEIMQKMMNDMMNSGINPETAKMLNEINRLIEENISDIINKNLSPEMINRQDVIISRLLQAEKSEREREIDDKRESNEAKEYKLSNPEKAFKEKEQELRFNELLQISNIKLNPFYQNKYKDYLKELSRDNE